MDIVPAGVGSCLYIGITEKIKQLALYMNMHQNGAMEAIPKILQRDYKTIEEAMQFYKEHCVLSYAYLEQEFEPVKEQYNRFMEENFPDKR